MELSVSSPSIEAWEAPPAEAAPVLMPISLGLDISAASPAIGSYMLWRMLPSRLSSSKSPNRVPVPNSPALVGLAIGLVVSCFWIASTVEL